MSTVLTAGRYRSAETTAGDAFADATFFSLLLISLPVKNSAYLVPPAFVAMQLLFGNYDFFRRTLIWGCVVLLLSTLSILADSIRGHVVNPPAMFLGIFTYGALAVLLGLRANFSISAAHWHKLTTAVAWFVIIQSILGLLQYAACRDPDAVCGTFGLLDFRGGITIGQVYLTFNLFSMVLFLLLDPSRTLSKVAIVIGLFACAVAHSGHQTLFFLGALALVGTLQMKLKDAIKLVAAMLVVGTVTASLSSIYWSDIQGWYRKVVIDAESPKQMVAKGALEIMSSPKNLLMGVGVGQFGSRAALISSGQYLTVDLPTWMVGESEFYKLVVVPARNEFLDHGENSAMAAPYCSALNQVVEFGLPLTVLVCVVLTMQFFENRQFSRSFDPRTRRVGIYSNVGLIFFVLCCFVENYGEFPQAVFLPALLYVAARTPRREGE